MDERNPEDFEWRFRQTLKPYQEKLEALPNEKRTEVENDLRQKFREHESDFRKLDGQDDFLEKLEALYVKQDQDWKDRVDRAFGVRHDKAQGKPDDPGKDTKQRSLEDARKLAADTRQRQNAREHDRERD